MPATTARPFTSIDEHPALKKAADQRAALRASLEQAQAALTARRAERTTRARDIVSARAARLLLDPKATLNDDGADQLKSLDGEITSLEARVEPLRLAISQHDAATAAMREDAQRASYAAIAAEAQKVLGEMLGLARPLAELNTRLMGLHNQAGGSAVLPSALNPAVLDAWLLQATSHQAAVPTR